MADITSNLLAYWKLDETSGTSAADSSGGGFTGTLLGGSTFAELTAAGVGQLASAVQFPGAPNDEAVSCGSVTTTAPLTVATWAKIGTIGASNFPVLMASASGGGNRWNLQYNATNLYCNVGTLKSTSHGLTLGDGVFHLVGWTLDGSGNLQFWVDGAARNSPVTSVSLTNAIYNVYLGHNFNRSTTQQADAAMARARIYSRALAAEDWALLYRERLGIQPTGGVVQSPTQPVVSSVVGGVPWL